MSVDLIWTAFARRTIVRQGRYTAAEIDAGLIKNTIYTMDSLPAVPPTAVDEPAFALVNDGTGNLKIAYWDYLNQDQWVLTQDDYENPVRVAGHVIKQNAGNGTGNIAWQHSLGPLLRIRTDCQADGLSVKVGPNGDAAAHAWSLLRSTTPGESQPNVATFTEVLASGLVTPATANVWEEAADFGASIALNEDDWVAPMVWIGVGARGGQLHAISALRATGELNEDYATVWGGIYCVHITSAPGANPTPTHIVANIAYGMCSLSLTS